jgi:anti-anti-sigma factor
MEAKVERTGGVYVVHLSGFVDFESAEKFRRVCQGPFVGRNVLFNLSGLHFVGSQGLTPFVETVVDLGRGAIGRVKVCGMGAEFKRVFEANATGAIELFDDPQRALLSFPEGV